MRSCARILLFLAPALLAGCDRGTHHGRHTEPTDIQRIAIPTDSIPQGTAARRAALIAPERSDSAELRRGREHYGIFCAPCHGVSGDGDGSVVRRGFPAPPSLHEKRLQAASHDHIVTVITDGIGKMYPLAERIAPEDRRTIAAYVKALQLSRYPSSAHAERDVVSGHRSGQP